VILIPHPKDFNFIAPFRLWSIKYIILIGGIVGAFFIPPSTGFIESKC